MEPFSVLTDTPLPQGNRIETATTTYRHWTILFALAFILLAFQPVPVRAFSILDALASFASGVANAAGGAQSPVTNTPALKAALNQDPNPVDPGQLTVQGGVALAPSVGPSGTVADTGGRTARSGQISLYVVRDGDTLGEIGEMFDVSVNTIIWANDLGYKGLIRPGQELVILPVTGVEYTTKKGDTLASLAKKYSADATEIAAYNGLNPDAALAVGTDLIIPGGEIAPPPTPTSIAKKASTFKQPLKGTDGPVIAGYYASPVSGILTQGLHGWNGVDIGAPKGTPVYASAAGTVIIAKASGYNGGLGYYVVISHPNGTETLYAHASKILVSAGQQVGQGEVIMQVGSTGLSTGPHVHFEVRGAGNPFASMPVGVRF